MALEALLSVVNAQSGTVFSGRTHSLYSEIHNRKIAKVRTRDDQHHAILATERDDSRRTRLKQR